jgi:hypothetical protein
MSLSRSLRINKEYLVQSFYDNLKGAIPYLGYPVNQNLGDVELFNLARKYLPFNAYSFGVAARGRYAPLAIGKNKYFLVGGGTLIFSTDILEESERLIGRGLKPLFLGTGAGDLPKEQQFLSRWISVMKESPMLAVRGKYTAETLRSLGLAPTIIGDLGYLINLKMDSPRDGSNHVVIVPRSIRPTTYSLFADDFEIRKKLTGVINVLLEQGVRVVIHSVSVDDYPVIRGWVKAWHNKVEYKEYNNSFDDFIGDIATARLTVNMRMHPGIFAFGVGTLPIMLDRRVKFKDSFSLFGDDKIKQLYHVIDPIATSETEITDLVSRCYHQENSSIRSNRFEAVRQFALDQKRLCTSIKNVR